MFSDKVFSIEKFLSTKYNKNINVILKTVKDIMNIYFEDFKIVEGKKINYSIPYMNFQKSIKFKIHYKKLLEEGENLDDYHYSYKF